MHPDLVGKLQDVRKVLITGGAGFIGSHIVEAFAKLPSLGGPRVEIVVLDNLRSGHLRNLAGFDVRFERGSVTDAALVNKLARGADFIFHLAAMISVPESMLKPQECVETNVLGTLSVLDAAHAQGVRKVVLSSSAAIYGDDPRSPKTEDMAPAPLSPYGITKLDGEYYLEMYRKQHAVGTTSLRYFNVFGPRQDPKSQYAAVVPIFIHRALRNEPLVVYGDGEQTRDFVFVKDVAAANILAAASPEMHGSYNVARGGRMTVSELAGTIIGILGSKSQVFHEPARAGDIKHSMADISRIQAAGFAPRTELADGLKETIAFFSGLATAVA